MIKTFPTPTITITITIAVTVTVISTPPKHMFPKKSLGQNFLTSEAAVFKSVQAAQIVPGETVLEVGPGKGVLTRALLDAGAHVIAIEKDHELIGRLSTDFAAEIASSKMKLVEADALTVTPESLGLGTADTKPRYKIVANLPYYITGQFLRTFLSIKNPPQSMVLLLQKEVVERIVATDKKESILSIAVKVYGQPRKVTVVKRGSFFPIPNVDSAVIAIEHITKEHFIGHALAANLSSEEYEGKFFDILHAGFAHKRKVLISNLAEGNIAPREKVAEVFAAQNISEKIRAEDLSKDQWLTLTDAFINPRK